MTENNPGDPSRPQNPPPSYRPAPGYPPHSAGGPGQGGGQNGGGPGQNQRPGQNPPGPGNPAAPGYGPGQHQAAYGQPGYGEPGFPPPLPPQGRQSNGFGITALVLGILALLASLIPFVGFIAFILGPLAILFGILGLALRRNAGKGTSITGMVLGAASIVVALVVTSLTAVFLGQITEKSGTADTTTSPSAESTPFAPATGPEATPSSTPSGTSGTDAVAGSKVELIATVSKGKASVTYSVGGDSADKDFTGRFTKQGTLDDVIGLATMVIVGDPLVEDQQLGCEIRVDGKTVKKETGKTAVSCTITKTP
ncbi:DUF308 domain-containing protein [Arthrobacter woluwensis]|uniref:DUF308 domain-containing protein n=1 Tax=Arthrobacter woluwensis TaxID=156980 RepID=UPI001AAEA530|nr:DUF308 domain-containing protein [Arthrobacter woluwensis]QTF72365.1 DUF4190 domain-containing protein [Arthrobacter woluwensis]